MNNIYKQMHEHKYAYFYKKKRHTRINQKLMKLVIYRKGENAKQG